MKKKDEDDDYDDDGDDDAKDNEMSLVTRTKTKAHVSGRLTSKIPECKDNRRMKYFTFQATIHVELS